ncbi:hypothetical protein [Virgisporangium ochraceum]|uniref:hypothetical protein n=1 Tax=Virgisporangium ochraceum TaxID=65505 RepID=UPI001940B850|nr:hypothetical protein [Virgisporangium ochraceum]
MTAAGNPHITRRIRFRSHVGVLDAASSASQWSLPSLPSASARRAGLSPTTCADRPTVSIIRSRS